MTKEQSKMLWEIELNTLQEGILDDLSTEVNDLYKIASKLIDKGIITYSDIITDIIDMLECTTPPAKDTLENRKQYVKDVYKKLTDKYESKYTRRESGEGASVLSTNSTEVSDNERLH